MAKKKELWVVVSTPVGGIDIHGFDRPPDKLVFGPDTEDACDRYLENINRNREPSMGPKAYALVKKKANISW